MKTPLHRYDKSLERYLRENSPPPYQLTVTPGESQIPPSRVTFPAGHTVYYPSTTGGYNLSPGTSMTWTSSGGGTSSST